VCQISSQLFKALGDAEMNSINITRKVNSDIDMVPTEKLLIMTSGLEDKGEFKLGYEGEEKCFLRVF
jgi:hypothetical protein